MPSSAKHPSSPNPVLAAAVAAGGLLLAALRRRPEAAAPARRPGPARDPAGTGGRAPQGPAGGSKLGRHAAHPADIPPRGWWQVLKRTVQQFSEDRVMTEAAGITFYTLLALFPALAALISIYALFAPPETIQQHIDAVSEVVPGGGREIVAEQVQRIAAKADGTLGLSALIGLGVALWSANAAMKALFDSLNVIYEEHEKRGFLLRTAVTMAFTLGAILFVLLAIAAVVVLPVVLEVVGLDGEGAILGQVLSYARWPVMLLAIGLFLALVYRYGPSRAQARWRWVSWGSGVASLAWIGGSLLFSWYVSSFGNYNETYGSLGAVVGFLTWIWISAMVVLTGAELDAELEHQTARDTTTGPERPMGARGARMADTVAADR